MADPLTLGLGLAGMAFSAVSAIGAGSAADSAAKYEAAQIEQQGKAELAEASHKAFDENRQRELALSSAQAAGAASGSDRDFNLEDQIDADGRYRTLSAVFEGQSRRAGRQNQAAARRYDGKTARRAGFVKAGASILKGSNSLLAKYG